jgi:hypothetical protein
LVLIFQGFLIWFFLNPERALQELYRVLGEALEKQKTKTSYRSGTLRPHVSMPSGTLQKERNFTKMPNIRSLLKR